MTAISRILVADPSPLFRLGVRQVVARLDCRAGLLEADSLGALQGFLNAYCRRASGIDLLLVDRDLPGLSRFEQLTASGRYRLPPLLMMAEGSEATLVERARRAGIGGVIDKSASAAQFLDAGRAVVDGAGWFWPAPPSAPGACPEGLSGTQGLVFDRLGAGMSNKQIAAELRISENTVKYHITQIYRKLDLPTPNRVRLAQRANGGRQCPPRRAAAG